MHCKLDMRSVIAANGAENGKQYVTAAGQGISVLQEGIVTLLARLGIPEGDELRFSMAFNEAACNGVEHGNLGADSLLRHDDRAKYDAYIEAVADPVLLRRVLTVRTVVHEHIEAGTKTVTLQATIQDEGDGFDLSNVPDPTETENLEIPTGRGIVMMRAFCDEVHFNETGNAVSLRRTFKKDSREKNKEKSEDTQA